MTQYTVLKVDKEDRIYVPTMLKYVGQIGTESKYANKYSGLVCLEFEDGNAWRFRNEWLEKVEEKEMESKFKVGDKVIHSAYRGIPIGRIGKVSYDYDGSLYLLDIWHDEDEEIGGWTFYPHELELVSEPKQEAQQANQLPISIGKKYRVVKVEKDWEFYCTELEEYLYMEGKALSIGCNGDVALSFGDGVWWFKPEWLVPVEEENQQSSQDNVNFPSHYQLINDIEVKDVVKVILSRWQSSGQEMSFNQAGMMKELLQYLLRAPMKNKKEDVLKAQWYLNELVKEWEEE